MSFDHTNPRCSDFSSFDFSNRLGAEVFSELAAEAWPYESERPPNRIKEGRLHGNGPGMGIQNKLGGGGGGGGSEKLMEGEDILLFFINNKIY